MDIFYNNARKYTGLEGTLEFVAWNWNLRCGVRLRYAGYTDAPNTVEDSVVVRSATTEEWTRNGYGLLNPAAFAASNDEGEFVIAINPYFPNPTLNLMLHEVGHVLNMSAGHSDRPEDILYPNVARAFGLTINDILTRTEVGDGISVPVLDTPDLTSAVLMPNMDVFHPDMRGATGVNHQGYLKYIGREDGYNVWELTHWVPAFRSLGNQLSFSEPNGDVFLSKVVSPDMTYEGAHLEHIGNQRWRLVKIDSVG